MNSLIHLIGKGVAPKNVVVVDEIEAIKLNREDEHWTYPDIVVALDMSVLSSIFISACAAFLGDESTWNLVFRVKKQAFQKLTSMITEGGGAYYF